MRLQSNASLDLEHNSRIRNPPLPRSRGDGDNQVGTNHSSQSRSKSHQEEDIPARPPTLSRDATHPTNRPSGAARSLATRRRSRAEPSRKRRRGVHASRISLAHVPWRDISQLLRWLEEAGATSLTVPRRYIQMGRYLAPILLFSPPPPHVYAHTRRSPPLIRFLLSIPFFPPSTSSVLRRAFVAPRLFFGTLVNR